ncbi:MAG: AmmeMemoRadiSam system radical SAM enzyme [Desulfobacterales bacterium]|nr:AmmeMemoRadiSam system radical SAM enzyme [Desulfobacterales bacterium]
MEALLYEKLEDKKVRCNLCHHHCVIKDGNRGICSVRENRGGILESLVYGKLIARHIDPIEKKPLFHYLPGSLSYSISTVGCNFRCLFCQNADIAQMPSDRKGMIMGDYCSPEGVVTEAFEGNCKTIAYTYTEPTVYFETALDTAKIAHGKGIKNVFVTNGYMTPEAVRLISPYLDAANVDLKAFNDDFYKKICGARRTYVLETLKEMKAQGIFLEITTLIVPGLNDDMKELGALADFIVKALGPEVPWHISRFHPTYKLIDRPATPHATLIKAREIGIKAGLRYVYTGNVPGDEGEHTYCYQCGKLLLKRMGFCVRQNFIQDGCCPDCGAVIDIVFHRN